MITSKKNSGSREPLNFNSIDPLFYLSSFQNTLSRKARCLRSGLFLHRISKIHVGREHAPAGQYRSLR